MNIVFGLLKILLKFQKMTMKKMNLKVMNILKFNIQKMNIFFKLTSNVKQKKHQLIWLSLN
ncbi:Uncharacterised protein [Mycobacteroides abscessus subsp. abscessus]|nr:Uncharacterised protein [Mycobacteroides abscessus subsp. abscessus]